jgi:hypothetical protein
MGRYFYPPHVHGDDCPDDCVEGKAESTREIRVRIAQQLCQMCPNGPNPAYNAFGGRNVCLEFAMATKEADGVWGGYTERQRRNMRNGRANGNGSQVNGS